jgi:hypothetical protein
MAALALSHPTQGCDLMRIKAKLQTRYHRLQCFMKKAARTAKSIQAFGIEKGRESFAKDFLGQPQQLARHCVRLYG